MQELTVASVEKKNPKKEGGSPFYVVKGMDGSEMTTFDAAILDCGPGTKLNVEVIVKGRHTNIDSWVVLEKATPQAATAAAVSQVANGDDPAKRLSIERQSSGATLLDFAARIRAAGLALSTNEQAEVLKALTWLGSRFNDIPASKLEADIARIERISAAAESGPGETEDARTQADKDFDAMARDTRFLTVGELRKWCADNAIDTVKFCELVGVKESEIPKVNIDEAHQIIKDYLAGKGG